MYLYSGVLGEQCLWASYAHRWDEGTDMLRRMSLAGRELCADRELYL